MAKKKRGPGRPRISRAKVLGEVVTIRLPAEMLRRLDAWCRLQADKPSRSEAVRTFVQRTLEEG
jgi:metal-responsive CopG/Arc/MetJ family transcriptional regulator